LGVAINALPLSPNAIFNVIQARRQQLSLADDDSDTSKPRTIASGELNAR
jgi:hypothetical protein